MRRFGIVVTATVLFSLLAVSQAHADDIYWTGATGSWHDADNWDNGVPTSWDRAIFNNGGTAQILSDADSRDLIITSDVQCAIEQTGGNTRVVNGFIFGTPGTYTLSGGELNTQSTSIGLYGSSSAFINTGGSHKPAYLSLGVYSYSSGRYNLSGTGSLFSYKADIGAYGFGEFYQSGGNNDVDYIYIGRSSGSNGVYNLTGGTMKAYEEYIGDNGIGQFIQDGGTNTKAFQIYIGYFSGSSGIYTLNGGEIAADAQYVGYWGSGEFNQSGGINTISHWDLEIGYGSGSIGAYNLSANGYLSVNRDESVGYYGTGEFNQTGGTNTIAGHLYLGYASGSSGTYNFSGGSLEAGGLDINYGWMDIDVSEIDLFAVSGDNVSLLDGYIAEDKIIDSTLSPGQYLYAFYDSEDDWTTLDVGFIPEPSTFLLLAPALLGFAGVVLKRRK